MALFQGIISHHMKIPTLNYQGIICHGVYSKELHFICMISGRVNSFGNDFYPDFKMVLCNRTIKRPSRKIAEMRECHLQSHGIGWRRTKLLSHPWFYYSLQLIWSLKCHKKHDEQLLEKKEETESLAPGQGRRGMVHLIVHPVSLLFIRENRKLPIRACTRETMQEKNLRKYAGKCRMSVIELLLLIPRIMC